MNDVLKSIWKPSCIVQHAFIYMSYNHVHIITVKRASHHVCYLSPHSLSFVSVLSENRRKQRQAYFHVKNTILHLLNTLTPSLVLFSAVSNSIQHIIFSSSEYPKVTLSVEYISWATPVGSGRWADYGVISGQARKRWWS